MLLSILLIIFLALLPLHSGESSQKSERSAVHICAHVHNSPLHTCSPTHLIAADSSHCWRHRSPSSALCRYCISATRFYPPFPPPLLQFRTFLHFFPPLPLSFIRAPRLPLFPLFLPPSLSAAIWRGHCLLSRAEAGKIITLTLGSDSLRKL